MQPSPWLIVAVLVLLALPGSAVFGLLAAWAWHHLVERRHEDSEQKLPH